MLNIFIITFLFLCTQKGISNNGLLCIQEGTDVVYFGVFDGYWRHVFISPIPIEVLHKDSLNICELFWDVKWESAFWRNPKNQYLQKYKSIYTTTTKYIFKLPLGQRVNLVFRYQFMVCPLVPFRTSKILRIWNLKKCHLHIWVCTKNTFLKST